MELFVVIPALVIVSILIFFVNDHRESKVSNSWSERTEQARREAHKIDASKLLQIETAKKRKKEA